MSAGRNSQRKGAAVEKIAAMRLVYLGFGLVCRISTPTALIRGRRVFCGKAESDLRAVGPGGISTMAEVKSRPAKLVFSDLEPHQTARLDQHLALGGLSLLIWHNRSGIFVLPWDACRAVGFGPGCSLDIPWAEAQQLKRGQVKPC